MHFSWWRNYQVRMKIGIWCCDCCCWWCHLFLRVFLTCIVFKKLFNMYSRDFLFCLKPLFTICHFYLCYFQFHLSSISSWYGELLFCYPMIIHQHGIKKLWIFFLRHSYTANEEHGICLELRGIRPEFWENSPGKFPPLFTNSRSIAEEGSAR